MLGYGFYIISSVYIFVGSRESIQSPHKSISLHKQECKVYCLCSTFRNANQLQTWTNLANVAAPCTCRLVDLCDDCAPDRTNKCTCRFHHKLSAAWKLNVGFRSQADLVFICVENKFKSKCDLWAILPIQSVRWW